MTRKLIFFDIDGTIIDSTGYIPPSTIQAIHNARTEGCYCIINTGRPYSHIDPAVRAIGFDGYVCSCGQHIVLDNQIIQHIGFEEVLCRKIVSMSRQCHMDVVYEAENGIWFDLTHIDVPKGIEDTKNQFAQRGFDINQSVDRPDFCFDKFCVFVRQDSDMNCFLQFIENYGSVIYREGNMLEITKRGYSKESGVRQIIQLLDVCLEDCYAIGDSTNDLPMLSCVSHSIAMGNAPEEVKTAAEYVTQSLQNDGVANALVYYNVISKLQII